MFGTSTKIHFLITFSTSRQINKERCFLFVHVRVWVLTVTLLRRNPPRHLDPSTRDILHSNVETFTTRFAHVWNVLAELLIPLSRSVVTLRPLRPIKQSTAVVLGLAPRVPHVDARFAEAFSLRSFVEHF